MQPLLLVKSLKLPAPDVLTDTPETPVPDRLSTRTARPPAFGAIRLRWTSGVLVGPIFGQRTVETISM